MQGARKTFKAILVVLQAGLVIAVSSWALAQGGGISGSVKDPLKNQGIQGVIIPVKDGNTEPLAETGTTDPLGNYSVAIPALGNSALEKQVSTGPVDPMIRELVRLVNAKRIGAGCPKLEWDDRIAAVAQEHSRDMVSRNFFDHTNPDGKNPFEQLKESNLPFSAAAENIALGPRTGKEAYNSWLKSPEHRRNMLACRFTRHGVGRAGNRWTHIFFTP
jgi:hypothetical protein